MTFVRSSQKLLREVCVGFSPFDYNEEIYATWISKKSPAKRRGLEAAWETIGDASLYLLATKELMVKNEVLLKWNDPSWAPRSIAVGSPEYNLITGPIQDELNKRLALAFDRHQGSIRFCMAYARPDTTLADFIRRGEGSAYEGDFSRNDRDQIEYAMTLCNDWSRALGAPIWYTSLLKALNVKYYVNRDYGLTAKITNQLDSGATNGTFRNTLWNASLVHHTCRLQRVTSARVLVLGDDALARILGEFHCDVWSAHCAVVGMTLKAKPVRLEGDATFLSRFFCFDTPVPCMIPLFGKALARFNARANRNYDSVSDRAYRKGKAGGYAYEFRRSPTVSAYFLRIYDSIQDVCEDDLELSEISWWTRQRQSDVRGMVQSARCPDACLSEDEERMVYGWRYDAGLVDVVEACDLVLGPTDLTVLEDSVFELFNRDM